MTSDKADSLRRDLLHSNFERMREITEDENDSTYMLAPSPSAPTLTDKRKIAAANESRNSNNTSTSNNNGTNKKRNNNSNNNNTKKSIHTNASPAEVFHRNLVDAVSNVDDSDENEHYVYPYSGNEADLNRPLSVRSTPLYENDKNKKSTNWFQALTNHPSSKLKEYIKENDRKHKRFYPPPRKRQHQRYQDGYTSDDEEMPLVKKRQQARKSRNSKSACGSYLLYIPVSIVALMVFVILYSAKPLRHLEVKMGRVLATDKELIFDLKVQAENANAWTVQINECDLSVFAFSQIVPNSIVSNETELAEYIHHYNITKHSNMTVEAISSLVADPAEYLGALHHFDEPLSISSNLFHNVRTITSQIRIKSPGADSSGNERWSRMIRYPYGLVVRGVMKYQIIPFIYPSQSLVVCHVARVDPTTGAVTINPDKSFCNEVHQM